MIRNKLKTLSLSLLCLALFACSTENDEKTEMTQTSINSTTTDKLVEKPTANNSSENFIVSIIDIKQSYSDPQQEDPLCSVDIKLTRSLSQNRSRSEGKLV